MRFFVIYRIYVDIFFIVQIGEYVLLTIRTVYLIEDLEISVLVDSQTNVEIIQITL